jgi:hypothetical protein
VSVCYNLEQEIVRCQLALEALQGNRAMRRHDHGTLIKIGDRGRELFKGFDARVREVDNVLALGEVTDLVLAEPGVEREGIRAGAARQDVLSGAAVQNVVAIAAEELVVACAAEDLVVA